MRRSSESVFCQTGLHGSRINEYPGILIGVGKLTDPSRDFLDCYRPNMSSRKAARRRHRKPRIRRRSVPGAAPGSISPPDDASPSMMTLIAYGPDRFIELSIDRPEQLKDYLGKYSVCWINVDGLADMGVIQELGNIFELHPLALEDVVNVHQRAKVEPYENFLFLVARMMRPESDKHTEQISFFLGRNYLITFQEKPGDCLDSIRERVRQNHGRIRKTGPDYLTYAILDSVIDSYFPAVEAYADRLDHLDAELTESISPTSMRDILEIRNELLLLRRSIRPHREAVNELVRDRHVMIQDETRVFLRDCYDHTIQLIDLLETYREMCADLREFNLSLASNRMNEIMKLLTIISTIFIPLSFIAGVYGMNFDDKSAWNMPELHYRFGYPLVLGLMATVSIGLIVFFWRKGWLGSDTTET